MADYSSFTTFIPQTALSCRGPGGVGMRHCTVHQCTPRCVRALLCAGAVKGDGRCALAYAKWSVVQGFTEKHNGFEHLLLQVASEAQVAQRALWCPPGPSQMLPRCLQMPPDASRCLPDASQISPRCLQMSPSTSLLDANT